MGDYMEIRKVLRIIARSLLIVGILADILFSVTWVKSIAILAMYTFIISIRNNYWWNFVYEGFVFLLAIMYFLFFNSYADQWVFYLLIALIILCFPLIIIQEHCGYPFLKSNDLEINEVE